jgi:hypothetical protein
MIEVREDDAVLHKLPRGRRQAGLRMVVLRILVGNWSGRLRPHNR